MGCLPHLSIGYTVAWSQIQNVSFWMEQHVLSWYSSCGFPLVVSVSRRLRLDLLHRIPLQVKYFLICVFPLGTHGGLACGRLWVQFCTCPGGFSRSWACLPASWTPHHIWAATGDAVQVPAWTFSQQIINVKNRSAVPSWQFELGLLFVGEQQQTNKTPNPS